MKPEYKKALIVLFFGLFLRTLFLEYPSLVDPTEARYAVVAQNMIISGNWLTPTLPLEQGISPYLGKPPLHFWLTALSYQLFGFDEWSSRLPSFVVTLLTLLGVFTFAKRIFNPDVAWLSALVFLSSIMPYVLAGASVTDVTLSTMVFFGTAFLYLALKEPSAPINKFGLIAAFFAALAFLTKGPVGLVLIWAPIGLWSLLRRDFQWIKRFPWAKAVGILVVISAPWFILNEIANPGFNLYFFWNENLARYLFKNYGDLYGSGHVEPRGSSWVMFLLGFLPWSAFGVFFAIKSCFQRRSLFPDAKNGDQLFIWCWTLITPIFFTFVRQLHAMYLLPAMAPASILLATWLSSSSSAGSLLTSLISGRTARVIYGFILIAIVVAGASLMPSVVGIGSSLALLVILIIVLRRLPLSATPVSQTATVALAVFLGVSVVFASLSPFLSATRSAKYGIRALVNSGECVGPGPHGTIGVATHNSFSHYWTANAWETELGQAVTVKYFDPTTVTSDSVCAYLLKKKSLDKAPDNLKNNLRFKEKNGDWLVFVGSPTAAELK